MLDKESKPTVRKPVIKKASEDKTVDLKPKDVKAIPGDKISMAELIKAQRKIDQNNQELGIKKEPISRARNTSSLPMANK